MDTREMLRRIINRRARENIHTGERRASYFWNAAARRYTLFIIRDARRKYLRKLIREARKKNPENKDRCRTGTLLLANYFTQLLFALQTALVTA